MLRLDLIITPLMTSWKQKAEVMFPELTSQFEETDTPYLLWFALRSAFERACEEEPRDESMIMRIYQYSDWCADQPQGETATDDLLTCVAVCFFEHIPEHPAAREDMPRWWSAEDLAYEQHVMQHRLSEEEFRELVWCRGDVALGVASGSRFFKR